MVPAMEAAMHAGVEDNVASLDVAIFSASLETGGRRYERRGVWAMQM